MALLLHMAQITSALSNPGCTANCSNWRCTARGVVSQSLAHVITSSLPGRPGYRCLQTAQRAAFPHVPASDLGFTMTSLACCRGGVRDASRRAVLSAAASAAPLVCPSCSTDTVCVTTATSTCVGRGGGDTLQIYVFLRTSCAAPRGLSDRRAAPAPSAVRLLFLRREKRGFCSSSGFGSSETEVLSATHAKVAARRQ